MERRNRFLESFAAQMTVENLKLHNRVAAMTRKLDGCGTEIDRQVCTVCFLWAFFDIITGRMFWELQLQYGNFQTWIVRDSNYLFLHD